MEWYQVLALLFPLGMFSILLASVLCTEPPAKMSPDEEYEILRSHGLSHDEAEEIVDTRQRSWGER